MLVDPPTLQPLDDLADVAVHARDHRRLPLVGVRPVLIRVGAVVGHLLAVAGAACRLVVGVRHVEREVEEKWLTLFLLQPLVGALHDQVRHVVQLGLCRGPASTVIAALLLIPHRQPLWRIAVA